MNIGLVILFADDERKLKIILAEFHMKGIPVAVCFANGIYLNDARISYPILTNLSDISFLIENFQSVLKNDIKT
jgi:hypothetical protein